MIKKTYNWIFLVLLLSLSSWAKAVPVNKADTLQPCSYSVTHDSLIVGHFYTVATRDSTAVVASFAFKKHFKWMRFIGGNKTTIVHYTLYDTTRYDSAYICHSCATHDTTNNTLNVILTTKTGLMPADILCINTTRRVAFTSTWNGGAPFPSTDTILLNIDYNWAHTFTTDTATFKAKCIQIANARQPSVIIIENEETLHGSTMEYCNELRAAAHGLMPLGYRVTNGGFVLPSLGYWYYYKTGDAAFLANNILTQAKRDSLVAGLYQDVIDSIEYEINVIMSLNLFAVDVHYYIGNTNQSAGLIRMLSYLSTYSDLPIIVTEAGIYNPGLLPDVVNIARSVNATHLIFYNGDDAPGHPLSIIQEDYDAAIAEPFIIVARGMNGAINSYQVTYSDASFLEAIDSIGPEEMRAPGGTYSKTFNWRTDVPSVLDLKYLVDKTHCRLTLVLNMVTNTLAENIAWIDSLYAVHAISDDFDCELGNESNGIMSEEVVKYGINGYPQECARWIAAISARYPTAKFAIPGGNRPGKYISVWNENILAYNPGVNLVFHYHNPRNYVFGGIVDTALVAYLIDSVKQAAFGNFPWRRIWVTEYNLRNEDTQEDPVFANDYQHGLAASFMMKYFYNKCAARVLFHNVIGAEGNGTIDYIHGLSIVQPTGEAIRVFIAGQKAPEGDCCNQ